MTADTTNDPDNQGAAEPSKASAAADEFIEIVKTIVYALGIALVLRVLLFQPFTIPSGSMIPNLQVGDYIIVTKYSYGYSRHSIPFSPPIFHGRLFGRTPTRGDIIVFKDPKDNRTDYIKRLIGLPGDRIQVADGVVYLNDKAIPQKVLPPENSSDYTGVTRIEETMPSGRKYITQDTYPNGPGDNTGVFLVPEGHYFFMGDNRDNSADSRFRADKIEQGVGFVDAENLVGRARIILFSWDGAKLYNPITWFTKIRLNRFFHSLK